MKHSITRLSDASQEAVNHNEREFVRGDVTTNTLEGYFSIFKRGMRSVYQRCDEKQSTAYLHEFDFRYSNRSALGIENAERRALANKGAGGKRLMYAQSGRPVAA